LAPEEIAPQPPTCAGVGPSKEASNQRRTGALNGSSGSVSALAFRSALNPPILRPARKPGHESSAARRLPQLMTEPQSTNYEKFQTGNPVVRRLIDRFYATVLAEVEAVEADSVLDAGCGEGETFARLGAALPGRASAVDIDADAVAFTAERFPSIDVARHGLDSLPFPDDAFDLVLCLEVLEHVPEPAGALRELARVAGERLVISVPHEPWFRLGSLMRGKYISGLGNHPEHVNHWNHRSLRDFLETAVDVVSLRGSFPWLIASCRPPRTGGRGESRPAARSGRA
jgi:SAM-dependent methyltransferase